MSEVSDNFLVNEIKTLRENESLLKKQISELRAEINAINLSIQSEYDEENKILTVYLKTGKEAVCLKYAVDVSGERMSCSPKYNYLDSVNFNSLVHLGNLVCPDDIRDLYDCIWRKEIQP